MDWEHTEVMHPGLQRGPLGMSLSARALPACCCVLAIRLFLPLQAVAAAEPERSVGVYMSSGKAHRLWSVQRYTGYKSHRVGLFKETAAGQADVLGIPVQLSVRGEINREALSGTISLRKDQVPKHEWDGTPYLLTLDGNWQIAVLCVPRLIFFPDSPVRPALHLGAGLSWLHRRLLQEGTHYNFNLLAGAGLDADIGGHWSLFADCRWEHYSNGGRMYLTNRSVIGLESVNAMIGIRRHL